MSIDFNHVQNTLLTSDDTKTTACSYAFPQSASAIIQTRVIGADEGQNTYVIEQCYAVKRGSGGCSIVDLPSTIIAAADNPLLMASSGLVVNGASVDLTVTGLAATGIHWGARIDIMYLN